MALVPTNSDALLKEVDEAVRQDDLLKFWQRFGRWLIGAVLVGLVVFGAWLFWQNRQKEQAEADGERFSELLLKARTNQIDEAGYKALGKDSAQGYHAAALLTRAGVLAQRGDVKGAVAAYGAIAGDDALAQPFRDLATLRQVSLQFDSLPPQQVIDRLRPFAEAGNPWFGSAAELSALAYLKMGKPDLAAALFAAITKQPDVPRTIQTRAVEMASTLGVDAKMPAQPGEPKDDAVNAE